MYRVIMTLLHQWRTSGGAWSVELYSTMLYACALDWQACSAKVIVRLSRHERLERASFVCNHFWKRLHDYYVQWVQVLLAG